MIAEILDFLILVKILEKLGIKQTQQPKEPPKEEKMENYEKYEGKLITYSAGDNEYKAKVALVDADIGITIVEKDNPNRHLVCLIMPGSPK